MGTEGLQMHRREKNEHLKSNIRYLIKSRGETQLSLCNASGLTRTTIYNILEGRVTNVQHSTVRKISDFFGVSYKEIEQVDFEEKEAVDQSISFAGNMNPAAVPIVPEDQLINCLGKTVGELVTLYPLTYYFGRGHNVLAVLLKHALVDINEPGDMLIVHKGVFEKGGDNLAYDSQTLKLCVLRELGEGESGRCLVGRIIEERFNDL